MSRTPTLLIALLLVSGVGLCGLGPAISQANMARETGARQHEVSAAPRITKAVLEKKTLTIEGENFADGAKLFVNDERVKSFNDEFAPTTRLIVNKANKRLPIDEAVRLQVLNADGQMSEPFGFFTGTTFTAHNTGDGLPAYVQVGRKFLIHFDDEGISWVLSYPPSQSRPIVEAVAYVGDIIPGSQGVYIAQQTGYAPFWLTASPKGQRPFSYLVNLYVVE